MDEMSEMADAIEHEVIHAGLHRAHREHLGLEPSDPVGCAECAMYAEWVAPLLLDARRGAWMEGMRAGTSRAMRYMSDEPHLALASEDDNPYRVERS